MESERRCAAVLAIPYRGCLGLALVAKRRGLSPVVRPTLEKLLEAGLYVGDKVMARVLSLAGE